jgi:hypothetical protein
MRFPRASRSLHAPARPVRAVQVIRHEGKEGKRDARCLPRRPSRYCHPNMRTSGRLGPASRAAAREVALQGTRRRGYPDITHSPMRKHVARIDPFRDVVWTPARHSRACGAGDRFRVCQPFEQGDGRMSALPIRTWTAFNRLLGLVVFASAEACGATSSLRAADSGPRDDGALGCASDTDCTGTTHCYFLVSDRCSATGVCLNAPFTGACRSPTWCSCDGTAIVVCAPGGYSPQPIASETLCDSGTPTDVSANH